MNPDLQPNQPEDQSNFQTETPDEPQITEIPESMQDKPSKKRFSLKNLSKKQKIILAVIAVILLAGASFAVWWFVFKPKPVQPQAAIEAPVEPVDPTIRSEMTGMPANAQINEPNVTGVMIENSPDARPQAGLKNADVVFEAVAEGGITRFLALFHDEEPKYVGPVRSARPYYLHWAKPFKAGYAHVGGSPLALQLIKNYEIRDLDQFKNSGAYERISSRYAPHNMYTGIDKLKKAQKDNNYKPEDFRSFDRSEQATPATKTTVGQINFSLSSVLYNARFDYEKSTNTYARSQAGKKHLDDKTGKQIKSDVVIALIMSKGSDGKYSTYKTTGKGSMYVFQNGAVTKGVWNKNSVNSQFTFTIKGDQPLLLNPGKVWVTVIGNRSDIKYKP